MEKMNNQEETENLETQPDQRIQNIFKKKKESLRVFDCGQTLHSMKEKMKIQKAKERDQGKEDEEGMLDGEERRANG